MGEMADDSIEQGLMQEAIDPCECCEFNMDCTLRPGSVACYRKRGMKCL